jgi:pimeloyl-ACP methyl ester carboxylesterase
MKEENDHLNDEQARHLTLHGAVQNEDGTYSWKFDNLVRMGGGPAGLSPADQQHIWSCITCPVLLVRGSESWASDPVDDGRIRRFRNARLANIERAGHWSHHDQLDAFMSQVETFLSE